MPLGMKPYDFVFTWAQPMAVVVIALVTFINYLGVRLGGQVQVALTVIKIAAVAAVVVIGFALAHGSATNFHPLFATGGTATSTTNTVSTTGHQVGVPTNTQTVTDTSTVTTAAPPPPSKGYIEICKQEQGTGLEGVLFTFTVQGKSYQVPVGACSPAIQVCQPAHSLCRSQDWHCLCRALFLVLTQHEESNWAAA